MAATVARCAGCGGEFAAARSHARWCSDRCRIAAKRQTGSNELARLADLTRGLVIAGELCPEEALVLTIAPTPRILAALARQKAAA
jgi:hypothetical protein